MTDKPTDHYSVKVGRDASGQIVAGRDNHLVQISSPQTATERVLAVAEALDEYARQEPSNVSDVRDLATRLRNTSDAPEQNRSVLQALLAAVVGAVAAATGTELGARVTELAVGALQSLG